MRKIIYQAACSLDAYIEGPTGEFDWCFTDGDYGMTEFLAGIDTIIYGRKSYELQLSMNVPFDIKYRHLVFSSQLKKVDPPAELIKEDTTSYLKNLLSQPGKNIWLFGGSNFAAYLLHQKLITEMHFAVHPLLLGAGKQIFETILHRQYLKLISAEAYDSGLVMLKYRCVY